MPQTLETPPSDSLDPSQLPPEMRELLEKMATPLHLMVSVTAGTSQPLSDPKHLQYINQRVMEAVTDRTKQSFIIIEVPVRHAKSFYCSWALPTWFLGMYPDDQVLLVTYSDDFSAKWGRNARDLFKLWGPELFGQSLDPAVASAAEWGVKGRRGGMRSVGVGGTITGIGGDLIIIDDPIKNQKEAMSDTIRKSQIEWFDSTLRTRLMPGGTLIILMARWHEGDIVGLIKERLEADDYAGDEYEIIHFPVFAEAPKELEGDDFDLWEDELGRKDGEVLWPEFWAADVMAQTRASMDPVAWGALYMQNPSVEGAEWFLPDLFRDAPYVSPEEEARLRCVRWWDLAASENEGDWTVGAKVGLDPLTNDVYVLDIQRFRKHPAAVEDRVKGTAADDGYIIPIRMEQERAGAGKTNTANYGRLLLGYDFAGIPAETKVEIRARHYAAHQKRGGVVLNLTGIGDLKAFMREHKAFPRGRHDDIVDAVSNALNWLLGGGETSLMNPAEVPMQAAAPDWDRELEEMSVYEMPMAVFAAPQSGPRFQQGRG